METQLHQRPPTRSAYVSHEREAEEGETRDPLTILSKPAGYLVKIAATQIEFFTTSILSLLSPFANSLSESKTTPTHGGGPTILRRVTFGLLGAGYAVTVLLSALAVAFLLGIGIVRMWVDEPVFLRRPLHFDYTQMHPSAAVSFGGGRGIRAVCGGHTVTVGLELLMPESDYNRDIGVFQVAAEVISANGEAIVSSSHPCMLRFRSLPVRLTRTFLMGVPLVAGISSESQKIAIEILRYKESHHKATRGIKVILQPRAGTSHLPQIYAAELILKSELPWRQELVYNWKWTFFVWISLYVYILLLILLACCVKPFVFPRQRGYEIIEQVEAERRGYGWNGGVSDDFSDALRSWRERSRTQVPELVEGSASSVTGGEVIDDSGDFAASKSSEFIGA